MRALSSLVALVSLALTIVLLPVPGGAFFAMVTFGLFLLALVGVIGGMDDQDVRQRNPSMNPTAWRDDAG
jgi:multisubunit Na+/H+ antiporter MnhB subunit